jgi:polysaccharide export outer membrane protein
MGTVFYSFSSKIQRRSLFAGGIEHLLLLLLGMAVLSSCYASTAIKGTPVKEVLAATKGEDLDMVPAEQRRADNALLSGVTRNAAFVETDGMAEYRLGPLDVIEIQSHVGDKISTTTVTINSRGRISYSFMDDLQVASLTPSEMDQLITEKLSGYVRNPRIDILVKEFNSKNAMIVGELSNLRASALGKAGSGRIYLQGKTTLMDLIALSGGYTVNADVKNVKLIREGRTYLINLYDIIEKGDESQNVIIDSGDVVNVPELPVYGERVYVMGEVKKPGIYSLKDARDLLAAIALADSLTTLAKEENTLIVRGYEPGKPPLVMMADLNAILRKADMAQNIKLKDGDLVYVPRMLIGDINDWITNTMPLLNFLFYPSDFESRYFKNRHLYLDH